MSISRQFPFLTAGLTPHQFRRKSIERSNRRKRSPFAGAFSPAYADPRGGRLFLGLFLAGLLLGLAAMATGVGIARAQTPSTPATEAPAADVPRESPIVYVLTFEGAVTPVLASYIEDGIRLAVENQAEAVILQLDTPGGSVDITKSITQKMLASPVPLVVYVSPSGAHAGSAGTFITLAAHVAAMAPGSSIGAASPVTADGTDMGETMAAKVKNILAADIENLASRRGERATEWAIAAVQEAAAATARQALELGVIDFIAEDLDDLLAQMDGFQVTVAGETRTLHTADATLIPVELNAIEQFLNFISDPSIASILLSLGILGLVVELRTPGFGVPGIVGIISLLLAFYALGQLDANFAGLALIALALALFLAEAFTPTFGVLAAGGAIAFVLGGVLLFDAPGVEVPWPTIIGLAVGLGGFAIFIGVKALAIQRRPPLTGGDALIGQIATARQDLRAGEPGAVFVAGEWWNAELLEGSVEAGKPVQVVGRRGYRLLVRPVDQASSSTT
ncbi:MAG: hypothetical protein KatS3mg050_2298 [Litorilinea sp.]|nr:MAG: hypothetical protein KatS3mg050_2298 [Litorilinea sp.]